MKHTKKILAFVVAAVLTLSMASVALAANTITIGDAVNGETYTAYKLMDASFEGDTVNDETNIAYYYEGSDSDALFDILDNYFQFDDEINGRYYVKVVDATGSEIDYSQVNVAQLAADINAAMKSGLLELEEVGSDVAANDTATITIQDKGYYFVNTSLGSVCAIDTAANTTIYEKNTETTQDKTVKEDGSNLFGDKNDAQIGDTVNFQTVVTIAKYQKNVAYHDVMQLGSLNLDWSSITVTGAGGNYTIYTPASDTLHDNFPASGFTGDTFAVAFDNEWTSTLADDTEVTITYSAELTKDAVVGADSSAMGEGNDNQSKVTYGNAQETSWDWTRTYTWEMDILKYTGEETDPTPLAGAVFNLKDESGQVMNFVDLGIVSGVQTYRIADSSETAAASNLTTPESGRIAILGLDANNTSRNYTLTEITAPVGYNKLTADITVTVTSNTGTAEAQGTDGTLQTNGSSTVTNTQGEASGTGEIKVLNNAGTVLPSTGGIGTTIFYIVGGVVVLGAIIILIVKKRKTTEE